VELAKPVFIEYRNMFVATMFSFQNLSFGVSSHVRVHIVTVY